MSNSEFNPGIFCELTSRFFEARRWGSFSDQLSSRVMHQQVREYFFIFKKLRFGGKSGVYFSKKRKITNLTAKKQKSLSSQKPNGLSNMAWIDLKIII